MAVSSNYDCDRKYNWIDNNRQFNQPQAVVPRPSYSWTQNKQKHIEQKKTVEWTHWLPCWTSFMTLKNLIQLDHQRNKQSPKLAPESLFLKIKVI